MAKGSIRFDNGINVEVAVDPSQAEGAKLLNAVNLADGQELSGGGNPNSVQVITGTLASVWDDLSTEDASRFVEAFNQGGASARIVCDLSNFGEPDAAELSAFYANASPRPNIQFGTLNITNPPHSALQVNFTWVQGASTFIKGVDNAMFLNDEVTDMSEYASSIPTTLTVYWHPMPETEGE